jgi:peptidoglycan hydrolase-like amidase
VRIGIVLAEDACEGLDLRTPGTPYRLEPAGAAPLHLPPDTDLRLRRSEHGVVCELAEHHAVRATSVRLACPAPPALTPGAGMLVRDVVAGRGFHWQKRMQQTLVGALELHCRPAGLVLVNELGLEDYLAGVITAEMSGACPADLLKAQCVVARSWLLALTETKHGGEPFDRCNDDCCQRYQGTADLGPTALAAVRDTRGTVLMAPTGTVLDANYAKSCGGISETPWAVWGLDKPGISSVVDAPPGAPEHARFARLRGGRPAETGGDESARSQPDLWPAAALDEFLDGVWVQTSSCFCSPRVVPVSSIGRYLGRVDTVDDYFRWTMTYPRAELEALLREKLTDAAELAELRDLRVRARGLSTRAYIVEVEWADAAGNVVTSRLESEYRIRQVLHKRFLYSSAFAVRTKRDDAGRLTAVTLRGAGWGHGVGLCQIGALGMALQGRACAEICRHYYPRATLTRVYT